MNSSPPPPPLPPPPQDQDDRRPLRLAPLAWLGTALLSVYLFEAWILPFIARSAPSLVQTNGDPANTGEQEPGKSKEAPTQKAPKDSLRATTPGRKTTKTINNKNKAVTPKVKKKQPAKNRNGGGKKKPANVEKSKIGKPKTKTPKTKKPKTKTKKARKRVAWQISDREQHLVYMINRARHDPKAYQKSYDVPVDLSYIKPRPPLAISRMLCASARYHSVEMANHDYFAHKSEVTGKHPNWMVRQQQFPLPDFFPEEANNVESIGCGDRISTAEACLKLLIVDKDVSPPGHRNHLLGVGDFAAKNREIGVGHAFSGDAHYKHYWTIHATRRQNPVIFLTGVVFNDQDRDRRYDPGEGLAGISIRANSKTTETNSAGGWSIAVNPGRYLVRANGAVFSTAPQATVNVTDVNVEVDFIAGRSRGIVNFIQ